MSINLNNIYRQIDDFTLDISLEIKQGELVSLLGPSGCGKSTTLRIIAGFEENDKGSVFINGKDIGHLPPEKRNVGMVFQDYALFPHMSVYENIAYGPKLRKWDKNRIDESVKRFLKIVHLEGFSNRKTENLSGGEQQRVALARALVTEPQLLLLDEPLSALDAKLRKNLRREIRRIQKELKITTIYVTHDQEEALAISDRIAVMNEGKCIQFDTPETLYREPSDIFSAGFIGNSNLIEVKNLNRETSIAETDIGNLKVNYIVPQINDTAYVFFRPDKCTPLAANEKENFITGIIVDAEYSGTHRSLDINSEGIIIKALLDDKSSYEIGDRISLHISAEDCRVII
jgi:ABC-type Fe3+/spermidine/putrescine transport system ATPase subunit